MLSFILNLLLWTNPDIQLMHVKELSLQRDHESALLLLNQIDPKTVKDRNSYFFYKAVAEFSLRNKSESEKAIEEVLDSFQVPDRYMAVVLLMKQEMKTWKDQDLGSIARKMSDIERRLNLARGGPQTQKLQKEVIEDLDKLIKEMEDENDKAKQEAQQAQQQQENPGKPLPDSEIGKDVGPGKVDNIKLRQIAESWGKLPEKNV